MPDIQDRIWTKYQDQGVVVAAVDANGDAAEGVQEFVKNMDLTYPVGLEDESTQTYKAFTDTNFKGANPFPVDVVIGKDGKIKYIAREYDPDALTAAIEAALAADPAVAD